MPRKKPDVYQKREKKKIVFVILPLIFIVIGVLVPKNYFCEKSDEKKPTYYLYDGVEPDALALRAVDNVLSRLGLQKVYRGLKPEEAPMDYDLLWTYYHFTTYKLNLTNLKIHQKLNHFPGNFALTSKSYLTTTTDSPYIPKAFLTAERCQEYAAQHPEKLFIIKLKSNRGIKLMKPEDMNITLTATHFAQEFIHNPLLWNGYKFDFSVFTVITSVNPLRLYYYTKTVNLRFCMKPYSIEDPEDILRYVIGMDFTYAQEFPAVNKFLLNGYTNRDAFEEMMRDRGVNVEEIWWRIEDIIRSIVMKKEQVIIDEVNL